MLEQFGKCPKKREKAKPRKTDISGKHLKNFRDFSEETRSSIMTTSVKTLEMKKIEKQ